VPVTEAGFGHERFAIYVWRSVRTRGDTKTAKSRPSALRTRQAADRLSTGALARDPAWLFCTRAGTPLNAVNDRYGLPAPDPPRDRSRRRPERGAFHLQQHALTESR
jgi:hypothetical protein